MKSVSMFLYSAGWTVGCRAGVVRICWARARTILASASKARWLATVGAWLSVCRSAARVLMSLLSVTWAWPPAEFSQITDGSAAGAVLAATGREVAVRGLAVCRAAAPWKVSPAPARMPTVAATAARPVSFFISFPFAGAATCVPGADTFRFGCGGGVSVGRKVACRLHCDPRRHGGCRCGGGGGRCAAGSRLLATLIGSPSPGAPPLSLKRGRRVALPDSDVIDRHGRPGEALGHRAAAVTAYRQVEDHERVPSGSPRDAERPIGQLARIDGQVDLFVLRELELTGIAVPQQAPDVPAGVDAARDRHLLGRVVLFVASGMDGRVRGPARLAVDLDHVDLAAPRPAGRRVVRAEHPPGRPGSGREIELDPRLEGPVVPGEQALGGQPGRGIATVPAGPLEGLDDQVALAVEVGVSGAVGVGLQFVVVGPPARLVIPLRGVRRRPRWAVELIGEYVIHHLFLYSRADRGCRHRSGGNRDDYPSSDHLRSDIDRVLGRAGRSAAARACTSERRVGDIRREIRCTLRAVAKL